MNSSPSLFSKICATKKYFRPLSINVTPDYISNCLGEIVDTGRRYGFHSGGFENCARKTVIVEFSSPNIAKRFHAGHFRSTIVGQAVSNIVEAAGNDVIRLNYLGDWGMQFAILAVGFQKYGSDDLLKGRALRHLFDVYVKASKDLKNDSLMQWQAQEMFCNMEQGDPKSLEFWEICRSASLREFHHLYESIGITFDHFESESMYHDASKSVLDELRQRGLLSTSDNGTEAINLSESSWCQRRKMQGGTTATLARSNGTSLYLTRDVAAALHRKQKYDFHKMYYVTDKAQELHFSQLFGILELMGKRWAEPDAGVIHHKTFGRVQGMKTREGDVVFFDDISNEAYDLVKTERQQHATRKRDIEDEVSVIKTLGLSGLICNDLKSTLSKDYRFRWDVALQSKGNTGIFLQYTHSRLQSLKRSCGIDLALDVDCSGLENEPTAVALVHSMKSYDQVAWRAYTELEPSHIVRYMFHLSHLTAQALKQLIVKDQALQTARSRLLLFHCTQIVLHNCMLTIGMKPLDKM